MGTLLIAAAFLYQLPALQPPKDEVSAGGWRDEKRCGVNALYGYLALLDPKVQLSDVERLVHPGPSGTSLWQLREAAGQLGFSCEIVKTEPQKLSRIAVPAVAHYSGIRDGHFVVIVGVRPKSIVIADMTTCYIDELPIEEFKKLWSGHLLVRRSPSASIGKVLIGLGFVTLVVIGVSTLRPLAKKGTSLPITNPGAI